MEHKSENVIKLFIAIRSFESTVDRKILIIQAIIVMIILIFCINETFDSFTTFFIITTKLLILL